MSAVHDADPTLFPVEPLAALPATAPENQASKEVIFVVPGVAAPAGSKRAITNRHTGRVVIVDDSKRSRPWKADVAAAAMDAMGGRPLLVGPLELHVRFVMTRPRGHYGSGRNAGVVRAGAPAYPTTRPDATKLLRALEDAMSSVVWRDDAQVVTQRVEKVYGQPAHAQVRVRCLDRVDDLRAE